VILARRLETQMAELDALPPTEETPAAAVPLTRTESVMVGVEDERERMIAKAALTVAELSM
jgi:hypothetical protein